MLRGSKESFYVISALSREQMKKNSYIRRDNLAVMNYLIKKECPEVVCLTESAFAPYFAAYSLCNVTNKQSAIKKLTDKGYLLLYWPDLPIDIKNLEYTPDIERLSEDIFVIPIHQDLSPCGLLEIYGDKTKKLDTSIEKIVFGFREPRAMEECACSNGCHEYPTGLGIWNCEGKCGKMESEERNYSR